MLAPDLNSPSSHLHRTIPRGGRTADEAYLRVWLGFIREQQKVAPEDVRDTFKFLKFNRMGDSLALLWAEWASFEARKTQSAAEQKAAERSRGRSVSSASGVWMSRV